MKIVIVGGTGLLGASAAVELVRRGHEVVVTSRSTPPPAVPELRQVTHRKLDASEASEQELAELFAGVDAVAYTVGPDERVLHPLPVAEHFERELVEASARVFEAAGAAGVKRLVFLGSYFLAYDRAHPHLGIAGRHPYTVARATQAEQAVATGDAHGMTVVGLEIPYVLGRMPGTESVIFDQMVGRFRRSPVLPVPAGSVTVTTNEQVGRAIAAVLEGAGTHGRSYPVGERTMTWTEMFRMLERHRGGRRPVVITPKWSMRAPIRRHKRDIESRGVGAGLDYDVIVDDILARNLIVDVVTPRRELGYGHADIEAAARASAGHFDV